MAQLIGIKRETFGRDGYTSSRTPDSQYDPVRAAAKLRDSGPHPARRAQRRAGDIAIQLWNNFSPSTAQFGESTRKILFFVPTITSFSHRPVRTALRSGANASDESAAWPR